MKNIVMTRIDDRLLHGQIVVGWIPYLKVNEVLVIDDLSAKDAFFRELIMSAAPSFVDVYVKTLEESLKYLKEESYDEKILIITKKISDVKYLYENGVKINYINVGNIGPNNVRKKYGDTISLSEEELIMLLELEKNDNCDVEIRMVPTDKKRSVNEMITGK